MDQASEFYDVSLLWKQGLVQTGVWRMKMKDQSWMWCPSLLLPRVGQNSVKGLLRSARRTQKGDLAECQGGRGNRRKGGRKRQLEEVLNGSGVQCISNYCAFSVRGFYFQNNILLRTQIYTAYKSRVLSLKCRLWNKAKSDSCPVSTTWCPIQA